MLWLVTRLICQLRGHKWGERQDILKPQWQRISVCLRCSEIEVLTRDGLKVKAWRG